MQEFNRNESYKTIEMDVTITLRIPLDTPIAGLCMTQPKFILQIPSAPHEVIAHETTAVREVEE